MGLTCAAGHIFIGESANLHDEADANDVFDAALKTIDYERVEGLQVSEFDLMTVSTDRWVSFFDPRAQGVVTPDFAETARAISVALKCPVIVTSVYDSDEFMWLVFHRGKSYDGYSSNNDLLPVRAGRSYPKKQAERWSKLFSNSISADDIKKLRRPSDLYADDRIVELARLIGIPIESATHCPSLIGDSLTDYKGYRQVVSRMDSYANDVPPYATPAPVKTIQLIVGQLETVSYAITISSHRLCEPVLEIFGSSIESEQIDVTRVGGIWHGGRADVRKDGGRTFQGELKWHHDRSMIRVVSPELNSAQFKQMPSAEIALSFWINIHALSQGDGELNFRFTGQDGDSNQWTVLPQYKLAIWEPCWTPLRGVKAGILEQDGFRMLNTPKVVSAVIIHEDRGADSMTSLRDLMETWLQPQAWFPFDQVAAIYEGQMNPESFHVPKRKLKFSLNDVGTAKKWANLFGRSDSLQSLFLNGCNEFGEPVGGGVVQRPCDEERPTGPGTIHTAFWVAVDGDTIGVEQVEIVRQKFASFIDMHFESLGGLQAWVGHWDWVPRFGMAEENNYTPYEDAVGIGSVSIEDYPGRYMRAQWCLNFLRAVSEQIWLNEALRSRIDPQRLSGVASTTNIGADTVRIDLSPGLQLDRLEEALLPILSS